MNTEEKNQHQDHGEFGKPDDHSEPVEGQVDETAEQGNSAEGSNDPLEQARREVQELKDQWTRE